METFTELKDLIDVPNFQQQRQRYHSQLDISTIDAPIVDVVRGFAELSYCSTLQSCYGHFLYNGQKDPTHIGPLPITDSITDVEYRIAYIALCIENSQPGRVLLSSLYQIPGIDPDYVQFGCAEWFWEGQVNSYALQVEPRRHKTKDRAVVGYQEALYIETIRDEFFAQLRNLLQTQLKSSPSG